MHWLLGVLLTTVTFCLMEAITWFTHRYVMHGFLWFLHRDHHQPSKGVWELNDAFSIIFAIPSIALFYYGTRMEANVWMVYVATGILLYGFAYFFVHDIIIHQRVKWLTRSKNRYVRALRWAHKMHHKHLGPSPGESFGFLWVEKKYKDKIQQDDLKQQGNGRKL